MIEVKDIQVLKSIMDHEFDDMLWHILSNILGMYSKIVITEGYRDQLHSNDLHGVIPVRAIDIRSWIYDNPEKIEQIINTRYTYDPQRPEYQCCVYHTTGHGMHFHIQVHPRTIFNR